MRGAIENDAPSQGNIFNCFPLLCVWNAVDGNLQFVPIGESRRGDQGPSSRVWCCCTSGRTNIRSEGTLKQISGNAQETEDKV
jgi:hypothetical protein